MEPSARYDIDEQMFVSGPIYLDNHATTPVDPRVLEAMLPFFGQMYGNAASVQHGFGAEAAAAVENAREQVATLIGARAQEIIFTSGATESDNLAIKGAADAQPTKRHIISAPTEHHAVLDCLKRLARAGYTIDFLPIDSTGLPDVASLDRLVRSDTLMVSVMAANNEVGTVSPFVDIGRVTRARGILFHCDAAQLVGKLPIDVDEAGIDLLSISAHKMYGPKGVGALFVRRRPETPLMPIIDGGGHERGLRSGTLNVPGCVGLGSAAAIAMAEAGEEEERVTALRHLLHRRFRELLGDAPINGHLDRRLPGNLNVRFEGADADSLMLMMPDIAVSSGSACTSASPEPSYVLLAMGLSYEEASQSIRFGIGRFNTVNEIEVAARRVAETVVKLRSLTGASV